MRSPRVAHTLFSMYALREHAQHLCHPVLSAACPGFLNGPARADVGATRVVHTATSPARRIENALAGDGSGQRKHVTPDARLRLRQQGTPRGQARFKTRTTPVRTTAPPAATRMV
jgi:hypothetical protein